MSKYPLKPGDKVMLDEIHEGIVTRVDEDGDYGWSVLVNWVDNFDPIGYETWLTNASELWTDGSLKLVSESFHT